MRIIAIDGTFSSGKGTLAKRLAAHYGLAYMDTGKLYRAVAKSVLDDGGALDDADFAAQCAQNLDLSLLEDPVLKSGPIGAAASKVSVHPPVRAALLAVQREFAARGAVLDGRDIGTVICPQADVKLFINAKASIRAQRRHQELLGYGEDIRYETVLAQLHERDARDMNRAQAPLKPAKDAHFLDTSHLSIEACLQAAVKICDAVLAGNNTLEKNTLAES